MTTTPATHQVSQPDSLTAYLNRPERWDIVERTLDVPAILRNAPWRVRCPRRAARRCAEIARHYAACGARLRDAGAEREADFARRVANAAERLMLRYSRQTDARPQRVTS